jgi:hypothetical protein
MKRSLMIIAALLTCSLTAAVAQAEDAVHNVPPEGFTALFNGKNLDGWIAHNQNPYKLDEMSADDRKVFLDEQWKNAL